MKNCTYVLRAILCLCVVVISGVLPGYAQQIPKSINVSNGDTLGFLEYKPADYDQNTTTKYPIIIFLHGIGERGNGTTQLNNVTCCGLPRIIKLGHKMKFTWNGKTETFLVLSPQCPSKYYMWPQVFVNTLIEYAKDNLRIDTNRIFLTGLSMGGGGTYRFISGAAPQPAKIAAAATICAPCVFQNAKYLVDANLPVWSFHAADDSIALAKCTDSAIKKINDLNPTVKPHKTIWPTGGHIVWDRVYTDTNYVYNGVLNIYEWFLGQNKSLPVNKVPVARAGNTLVTTTTAGTVKLDASASTDEDGKLVRYVWKKLSGPSAGVITKSFGSVASTTITGLTLGGTYQYELTVVDDRAGFSKDTVTLHVSVPVVIPNKAPVAVAGADLNIILPRDSVIIKGNSSYDEDGTIKSFKWSNIPLTSLSGVKTDSSSICLNNLKVGVYNITLTVTDNKGDTASDVMVLTVKPNMLPIAIAGPDDTIQLSYRNKAFINANLSKDPDGWIKSFAWKKISGPGTGSIETPASGSTFAINLVKGVYVFRVTVTDNKDATSYDDVTITVELGPNTRPVAIAGDDKTIALSYTNRALINASLSKDPDGWINSFFWKKISGPASCIIENAATSHTFATNLTEGVYVFRVTVTDNRGGTASDDLQITVNKTMHPVVVATPAMLDDQSATIPGNIISAERSLVIYPNPAINTFNLRYTSGNKGRSFINIYDQSGRIVKNFIFTKGEGIYEKSIPVNELIKGIYHVMVRTENQPALHTTFVKE